MIKIYQSQLLWRILGPRNISDLFFGPQQELHRSRPRVPWPSTFSACWMRSHGNVSTATWLRWGKWYLSTRQFLAPPRTSLHTYNRHLQSSFTIVIYNRHLQSSFTIVIYNRHLQSSFTIVIYNRHLQSSFTIVIYNRHLQSSFTIVIYNRHHHHHHHHNYHLYLHEGSKFAAPSITFYNIIFIFIRVQICHPLWTICWPG